jgi:hypothetical protein
MKASYDRWSSIPRGQFWRRWAVSLLRELLWPLPQAVLALFIVAGVTSFVVNGIGPFIGGLYYTQTGQHVQEQCFFDKCIAHLKVMRANCDDPDLQGILDYTIRRYNRIGAWDVMIAPLPANTLGCNCPWCPGMTLDTEILLWEPEDAAIIVVHEALHDYFPYLGHGHIDDRERRLWKLSNSLPRPVREPRT